MKLPIACEKQNSIKHREHHRGEVRSDFAKAKSSIKSNIKEDEKINMKRTVHGTDTVNVTFFLIDRQTAENYLSLAPFRLGGRAVKGHKHPLEKTQSDTRNILVILFHPTCPDVVFSACGL